MRRTSVKANPLAPPSIPSPQPVDPEEMMFALNVFQAGLRLRMPTSNPENKRIDINRCFEAQKVIETFGAKLQDHFVVRENTIAFKDNRFHRGLSAVEEHYKDSPLRTAILARVFAFYFLVNRAGSEAFQKWTKPGQDGPEGYVLLHPAVIEAVASAPTGRYGEFDKKKFFGLVEQIAAEYPEDEEGNHNSSSKGDGSSWP